MGPRIVTAEHLMQLARDRRSVTGFCGSSKRPMPAAFLVNMQFRQVMRALSNGLEVYEPEKPVAPHWWEFDRCKTETDETQES